MAFNGKVYSETNSMQENIGIKIVDLFLQQNPGKYYDIIVDIGCGTGNVTKILSEILPHNRIIAFDINSDTIEFAKQNFSSKTIEYFCEDISKPWDQLIPEFKSLESKVSLIFSNFVLHWIENKENAVKNITKLLKNDGNICLTIGSIFNVFPLLRPQLQHKFVEIPSFEQQFNFWEKNFSERGIEITFSKSEFQEHYIGWKTALSIVNVIPKVYKLFLKSQIPEETEQVLNDPEFKKISCNSYLNGLNQKYISDPNEKHFGVGEIPPNIVFNKLDLIGIKK